MGCLLRITDIKFTVLPVNFTATTMGLVNSDFDCYNSESYWSVCSGLLSVQTVDFTVITVDVTVITVDSTVVTVNA